MNRKATFSAIAVVILALVTMGRCLRNDFVTWDDPQTITDNPDLHPPTFAHAMSYWRSPAAGLYVPLTYTAWSILARFSLQPWAFHLTSMIAHAIASLLCFRILRRVIASDVPAMLGAILFATHPLQVESVAWASGLKDLLAGLFALAAIDLHISRKREPFSTILSSLCFALAMLAKPSAASAIPIALAIDLIILRRNVVPLIAWVVIAIPLLIVARQVQDVSWIAPIDWWKRPLIAADAIAFYLMKLVGPIDLCIDYGRNPAAALASSSIKWTWILPTLALLALSIRRNRTVICAAIILLSGLMWNLGLTPFQFQLHSTVADHYMYLAMLGPALLIAWLTSLRLRQLVTIVALMLACCVALSIHQIGFWKHSIALFEHTLAINDRSVAVHQDLGRVLGEAGDFAGAEKHFRAAIKINPKVPEAYRDLFVIDMRKQNVDAAIADLTEAVRLYDESGQNRKQDRSLLVTVLAGEGRWREVVQQLETAASADPTNPRIAQLLREARANAATQP